MSTARKGTAILLALILSLTGLLPVMLLPTAAESILTLNKTTYLEGEDILVTATGAGTDWVGLYAATDGGPGNGVDSIRWYYVAKDGNTSGTEKSIQQSEYSNNRGIFNSIPAGDYMMFLCANDGYTVLAQVAFTVTSSPEQSPDAPTATVYTSANAGSGRADGTLTVTEGSGSIKPTGYIAYWANKEGPLPGFSEAVRFARTDAVTTVKLADYSLIPAGADRLLVFALRKNTRSEVGTVALLPEGAGVFDPGKLLGELQVMSDIHINASDDHLHNRHFAMALADIKVISPASMGIFINGDIGDHGQVAEYDAFRRLVAQAGDGLPPVLCAIGNHDHDGGLDAQGQIKRFLEGTGNPSETVWFDRWIGGFHFVFLGGESVGLHANLSGAQLRWLDETLAADRVEGRPTFVFLHQGLMDTVAGTFEYQNWHGVQQSSQLRRILKQYPEVVLFSGHSHWTMESPYSIKPADESLPNVVSTASCAYLWDDSCMATNVGIVGSEGYYLYLYESCIVLRGRSFDRGEWIGSAQFVLPLQKSSSETTTETETETESATDSTVPTESASLPVGGTPESTGTVTEPTADITSSDASVAGCNSFVSTGISMLCLLLIAGMSVCFLWRREAHIR